MPIISTIGRRHWKVRLLILGIYLTLIAGGVTMIYPFLIMLAGSSKSAVDGKEFKPYPTFLRDDAALYRKHIEGLFNEGLKSMQTAYDGDETSFEKLDPPPKPNAGLVAEWRTFVDAADLPDFFSTCGYVQTPTSKTMPLSLREFKSGLQEEFDGDLTRANEVLGTSFVEWHALFLIPEDYLPRRSKLVNTPLSRRFQKFKAARPRWNRYFFCPEGFYKAQYLKARYTRKIEEYNQEHGTRYESYDDVHLSRRLPEGTDLEKKDWEIFVRDTLNLEWIRADAAAAPAYRAFLRAKYGDIQILNDRYQTAYGSFDEVPLIQDPPDEGLAMSDWESFLVGWKDPDTEEMHILPIETVRIHSVDFLFRDSLKDTYGTIAAVNEKFGTAFKDFLAVLPPQRDAHYLDFLKIQGELRWEFTTRNFKAVLDYMVFHGRGVLNTVIYCTLAVVLALLVNPLAAYAMSRFKMPATYKILLFLMLTMAFPPMVAQIPQFLMLRELGLLNTFGALVLPGLANGYAIFLLKGFFDSLPEELYESAALDGASEIRIFWQITMSLSKPILAVIALQAFTMAYSNFMMALLICQDESMWTLMVWLYQLQQRCGEGVRYASLLIAAIPTLLIFMFCQNIIMRGIVVPVEK